MLAVTGGKGGVGKTTTALGVARALGERGVDVLAVDADRDLPDLARTAGVDTGHRVERSGSVTDGLGVSPGVDHPDWPGVRLLTLPRDRTRTRRLLDALATRPERVVVDCPAGAGRTVAGALRAADRSLLVTSARPASLRDGVKAAAMARTLAAPPVGTALLGRDTLGTELHRVVSSPVIDVPRVGDPLASPAARTAYRNLSERATLRNC
ncbi:MinD/ParA family ATP-binding protein [Halomarina rubra]|uniref:MinD/ParA family protein n=1 Tax=Halomarina rubra TaxID=2071873 RepID=A0ABD6B0Q5_9EURY|nr:AAA family ATPase [Halomarina rubra]